jgi:hypothetical protein
MALRLSGILYAIWRMSAYACQAVLTISSAFLILKDLQRKRLAVRLTKAPTRPTPIFTKKNIGRDAIAAACAAAVPALRTR